MATAKLIPTTVYNGSSSYLTITNSNNMCTDTSSTTYGTVQCTRSSTTSYYVYLRGFDFTLVPSDAIVSNITIKVKGYHSGGNTSTLYMYSGTSTQISACGSGSAFGTSASVITFSNTTISWDTLKSYGSNLGLRINCRRSSKNNANTIYIYGAEIDVTYTLPVYYDVTISNSSSATVTASESHPLEGTDVEIRSDTISGITIKDNGTEVTSQFTQRQDAAQSYSVTNVTTTYGFALNSNNYYESNNKAHASSAAVCRVDIYVPVSATVTFSLINYAESTYDYGLLSNIDTTLNTNASADTSNVYWNGKNNNSSSVQTVTYSNVTAGEHYIYVKYFKDSYTDSNNDSLQFKIAITLNESFTPGTYYGYDISSISADHTIVVAVSGGSNPTIYYKVNGSWVAATAVYKKVSGSWVLQSNLSNVFDANTNYVKG